MKASVSWVNDAMFLAESGSGHCVVMDGPQDLGGRNAGVRPMEMLLMGVGGCSSFDVMTILRKTRQEVIDCRCELTATRVDAVPAVFEKIHLHFKLVGKNLDAEKVKRAVELSAEKYCSASIMLKSAGIEISHDFEISEL
jgi:putative redox protein